MKKRKRDRNVALIQSLTLDTFVGRRDWIQKEQPHVSDVIAKFPSLKMRKVVSVAVIVLWFKCVDTGCFVAVSE